MEEERDQQLVEFSQNENSNHHNAHAEAQEEKSKKRRVIIDNDLKWVFNTEVAQDLSESDLESCEKYLENIKSRVHFVEEKIQSLQSGTNINTIIEYRNRYVDYKSKRIEFDEVNKKLHTIKQDIDQLKKLRFDLFMAGFNTISAKLKETYQVAKING